MPVRNLSRSLGAPSKLTQSFGQNSQPLAGVRSGTQGINYALQELLAGLGIGEDRRNKAEFDAAIQKAMIEDPATITTQEEYAGSGVDGAMYDAPAQKEETSANPNRRSLKDRLSAAFKDISGNPNVGAFNQSMIPGRLAADLAQTQLDGNRQYAAGLASTKRAQQLADQQTEFSNKKKLKELPGSPTGRASAPIQNHTRRQELVAQYGEGSSQVRQFDTYVRADKIIDHGGSHSRFNPQAPGKPEPIGLKTIPPQSTTAHRAAVTAAETEARNAANRRDEYIARGIKSETALAALASVDDLIKQSTGSKGSVDDLIDQSTGSWGGAALDILAAVFGHAPNGALAVGKLKVLQANLMLSQPKMQGPQSDKDVQLYREAAGQIGDPTVPNAIKKGALDQIRALHKKYAAAGKAAAAAGGFTPKPGFTAVP